jgi:AraC-like DNA-binding protein
VLDAALKPVYGADAFSKMDDRLREQLLQHAEHRLANLAPRGEIPADRLQTPDSRGDLWTFRAVTFRKFSALSNGIVIFFCMQPESLDWATIRPGDFQADQEMVRLVPAIQFMRENFQDSPTLSEISRSVYLSPFHFHRRFTELFGLTPKHFLLECQIYEAKRQLMTHQKELAQIASDCGFAHQSHFTSRFKQATGLTPTRWRRVAQDMQRSSTY